jgi:hypothetical protein
MSYGGFPVVERLWLPAKPPQGMTMQKLLAGLFFFLAIPASQAQACPLLSFTPCKSTIHRAYKPKPSPVFTKHEARIASHDRWLAAHDAQFRAMAASIVSLQRQINELKAKR